ncbi:hypothetical protein BC332_05698 [Capsicum chinense]|nr:hypothetical protein BC332_05698 [Capsicum chinense]
MRSMSSSASSRGIAAIVGVGPQLGRSIARNERREGSGICYPKFRIDCSNLRSVREAFEGVLSLGFVEVLVYNAYQPVYWNPTNFTHVRVEQFEKAIAVSSVGAFHCAQQVLPGMVERGRGTVLFSGCSASLNGFAGYSELCCGRFAVRGLSQCLAREFQPLGIHVAHVIIHGIVGAPRGLMSSTSQQGLLVGEQEQQRGRDGLMDPDALAQTYWYLHIQDRCAWTQEIDLHPSSQRCT